MLPDAMRWVLSSGYPSEDGEKAAIGGWSIGETGDVIGVGRDGNSRGLEGCG